MYSKYIQCTGTSINNLTNSAYRHFQQLFIVTINLKRRKARIFITNRPIKTPRVCVWQPYEPTPVVLGLLQVRGLTTLTTPSVYTILRYITHYYWICDVHLLLVESPPLVVNITHRQLNSLYRYFVIFIPSFILPKFKQIVS